MNKPLATLVFILFCALCTNLWAGPAAPLVMVLSQQDGTTFKAIRRGDEYRNWIETLDGHSAVNDHGTWFYAERDKSGGLRATSHAVGSTSPALLQSIPLHTAPKHDPDSVVPRTIRKIQRNESVPGIGGQFT